MRNPVGHWEIVGSDALALQKFYANLFDWDVQNVPELNYGIVAADDGRGIGGGIGQGRDGSGHVTFYVEVDDPQAYLDKAEELGGRTIMPVTEMPMVTFALFADPEDDMVGVVKAEPQS